MIPIGFVFIALTILGQTLPVNADTEPCDKKLEGLWRGDGSTQPEANLMGFDVNRRVFSMLVLGPVKAIRSEPYTLSYCDADTVVIRPLQQGPWDGYRFDRVKEGWVERGMFELSTGTKLQDVKFLFVRMD